MEISQILEILLAFCIGAFWLFVLLLLYDISVPVFMVFCGLTAAICGFAGLSVFCGICMTDPTIHEYVEYTINGNSNQETV